VAAVQALLEDAADVRLVSISVDPGHDTPAALARYAATFDAGMQWTFLTGRSDDVDDVLRRLGQWTENPRSHTTLFIAGNAATGHWMKLHPDLTPALIAAELRALVAETPRPNAAPASPPQVRSPDVASH
jgi:protein SCO1/2